MPPPRLLLSGLWGCCRAKSKRQVTNRVGHGRVGQTPGLSEAALRSRHKQGSVEPEPRANPPGSHRLLFAVTEKVRSSAATSNTAHDRRNLKQWQRGWGRARRAVRITPPRAHILTIFPWQAALPCVSLAAINPLTLHRIYSLTAFYFGSRFPPLTHSLLAVNMLIYLNIAAPALQLTWRKVLLVPGASESQIMPGLTTHTPLA